MKTTRRWIGRGRPVAWLPRSPDLRFLSLGLYEKVYAVHIETRDQPIIQIFVYRAIDRYKEKNRRNPVRKQMILSREIKLVLRTMSRILNDDLELTAYKMPK